LPIFDQAFPFEHSRLASSFGNLPVASTNLERGKLLHSAKLSAFFGGFSHREKAQALFFVFKTLITLCLINIQDLSAPYELSPCILSFPMPHTQPNPIPRY
jgi:hypothetical protein